mmetsp:Transcript_9148/g.23496  ORF Transcript_9148/g.23496 Transcript_9148/m.23496 type:complete len:215 (+) Transcript_9148:84-728(+)
MAGNFIGGGAATVVRINAKATTWGSDQGSTAAPGAPALASQSPAEAGWPWARGRANLGQWALPTQRSPCAARTAVEAARGAARTAAGPSANALGNVGGAAVGRKTSRGDASEAQHVRAWPANKAAPTESHGGLVCAAGAPTVRGRTRSWHTTALARPYMPATASIGRTRRTGSTRSTEAETSFAPRCCLPTAPRAAGASRRIPARRCPEAAGRR